MDAAVIVICLSTGFQLLSAFFAAKLLLQPGRRMAGVITFSIILLMAFRRFVSLYRLITVGGEKTDFFAETLALSISLLIFIGVLYLSRLIASERKMASMLADSMQHYQTLFNLSPYGVVLVDMKGNILESNDAAARDLGYTREEFSRLHLSDINPFKSREDIQGMIEAVYDKGKSEFEVKHRTKGGDLRDVHVITQAVELSGKRVSHSIWRDITDQKRANDSLRESRARFQAIFDQNNDGISVADLQGHYVMVNPAFCRMTGYSRDELLQMRVQDLLPENTDAELFQQVSTEKKSGRREVELRRKDGTRFFASVSGAVLQIGTRQFVHGIVQDITERRESERRLRESEDRFRSIFEHATDGIMMADIGTNRQIEANSAICAMLGYTRDELLDLRVEDVHPREDLPRIRDLFERQVRGEISLAPDIPMLRKDGTVVYADVNASRVILGEKHCLMGIFRNITERKRAEKELQEKEEKYQLLFESANDGIFIHDETGFIDCNQRGAEMYGLPKEEIVGRSPDEFAPERQPDGRLSSVVAGEKIRAALSGTPQTFPWQPIRADGKPFDVEITLSRIELGGKICLQAIVRDTTGRKQAEEAKDRLLRAVSAATEGIAITDEKDRFIYVNDAHARIYGYLQDELIGKTWRDTVTADVVPLVEKDLEQTLHNRAVGIWSGVGHALRKDGAMVPTEITATSRWDEMGNYLGHICIVRDITERRRAEEKIRESEQFIRNILDSVDEGFIVIDRDFRILTANKAYCRQVGRACDEVIGRNCFEVSHKTNRPCYEEGEDCAVRRVFDTGEPHTALHRHTDAKGSLLYVETKAYPIRDSSGTVTSVIETITNITERHLLEEERLKTQKLEAIGTLAGGIAHDFNNLLQGIFGYISLAKMTIADKERTVGMLEQAEQALHMSVNLTTQLLTFSKGGKPIKTTVHLQPLIENSARFALSGSRADYSIKADDDLWAVEADKGQLGQVIQNIVLNADQAMPDGGTIAITARNVQAPKKRGLPRPPKGRYVEIAVRDTGIGIPANYLQKIFDPYFTTKEKGSGLGLATSYSIIKNHGGLIDVVSESGTGTTFIIYLPAVEAEREIDTTPAVSAIVRKGKILIMDDEDLVRNIAGSLITSLGHEVDVAGDGESAVSKYREARDAGMPFDIVILDLTVRGGMGGREAIERLHAIDPDVRAIVSSGYSDNDVIADYKKYGFMACLTKPYDILKLGRTLDVLLKSEK